ncbi:CLOCK-interacting pacemaker isoform X2 [Oncorhynchus keta]|uniref:CLOCK-interacting pacemaker isoform X2 n=1 Tax=Oncorhynchus keta TaxID=8018 RepID=UPI00227B4E84|nr:CLOCK-interacting pacemaker isoform X2 [Oncorhynchus keta]
MPLEQACLSGREPRATSKNAEDRSNTATLLASRSTADTESNRRGSRCGSEKDSGYSDNNSCTDWLHADREDQGGSVSEPRGRECLQSQVKPEQAPLQGNHTLVPSPGSPGLTPIFIIRNVVLKQNGSDHHLQNQLNWENRGGSSNDSGPCHMILVQQPSEASATSPKPNRTQSWRSDSTAMKTKSRTYLPILKSYPHIAPHPSKKPSDITPVDPHGKGTGREDQSQDKRMCTEDKRDEVSTTTHLLTPSRKHVRKQPDPKRSLSHWRSPVSSLSPSPRSPSTLSSFVSRSMSSSDTTNASSYSSSGGSSPLSARRWPSRHGPGLSLFSAARDRRFLNTVGILSQSGLLDITLRTQDLLRQSNATDRDIAQLRQHTQLLYQAANHQNNNPYNNDPDNNDPNANTANAGWERIHQVMAQSGCYPSLKNLGREEDHNTSSPEPGVGGDASFKRDSVDPNIATHTHNGVEAPVPPSSLLVPMSDMLPQYCPVSLSQHSPVSVTTSRSHSGQASAKPPETVTIMPPDSSTHGDLL